jgi:hypothetical protein
VSTVTTVYHAAVHVDLCMFSHVVQACHLSGAAAIEHGHGASNAALLVQAADKLTSSRGSSCNHWLMRHQVWLRLVHSSSHYSCRGQRNAFVLVITS